MPPHRRNGGFTLIELLVVIAIIAILAVVVVLTLNPAQLLAQSRDANRVSDMATLQSALNLYTTDQSGNLSLGNVSSTYVSVPDPNASSTCGSLGLPSLSTSTGQSWACSSSSNYRLATSTGWVGTVNFNLISAGSPFGSVPVDPVNQTSSGLFYAYNTNGSQFQVTASLESSKYKATYGANLNTTMFPEVISGGTPGISALYNPTGLVGYWPLDEGNGSTTVDQSGNGDNGTWNGTSINGTYYTSGKVGSFAGNFNGTNDYVGMGTTTALTPTNFTLSAWVYLNTYSNDPWIIARGNWSTTGYGLLFTSGGGLRLYLGLGSSATSMTTSALSINTWYLLTATYSNGVGTLYVNGKVADAPTALGTISYGVNDLFVLGDTSAFNSLYVLNGDLDDVRIYNRALSTAEVAALYNAEK